MRQELTLYFTQAEFMLMLELAGGGECSVLSGGALPGKEELTLAFASLFQRGLLRRQGEDLVPDGAGALFEDIRRAPWAVRISGPEGETAVCYVRGEELWLVELADVILSRQYRVRRMDRGSIERWLFDSGLLEPPVLTREDLSELDAMEEELPGLDRRVLLRVEKYRNGGEAVEGYEVFRSGARRRIGRDGQDVDYTREALSQMLADCFGKESHDNR